MTTKKRMAGRVAALMLLLSLLPLSPAARALETSAASAILLDATTGQVLYEKSPDKQMLIASTTKILTAIVAIRDGKLTDAVTVSRYAAGTEGSSMYLKAGETLSLEALLYGLMLMSGNDAATAIAEHIAGSVPAFAERMNATAQSLGMTNSSFANPHGLNHEKHYSTARDMAKLANAAMDNETLRRITSTRTVTMAGRSMKNHNKLLWSLEGCIGLKTGYTKAAGRTLVTCCERGGRRLIAVTLKDGNDWADHAKMYEYGFSTPWEPKAPEEPELAWPVPSKAETPAPVLPQTKSRNLTVMGNLLGEAPISGGLWATVPIIAGETLGAQVPEGATVETRLEIEKPMEAPMQLGTKVGVAVFLIDGVEWGRAAALCGEDVPLKPSEPGAAVVATDAAQWEQSFYEPGSVAGGQSYGWETAYLSGQSRVSEPSPLSEQTAQSHVSAQPEKSDASAQSGVSGQPQTAPPAVNWEQVSPSPYNWETAYWESLPA